MKQKILIIHLLLLISSCASKKSSRTLAEYENDLDPRVPSIVANTIGIDAHNHVDVPLESSQLPGPQVNFSDELKKSGLSTIGMTFAVDYQKLTTEGQAYDRFLNGLKAMDTMLLENNVTRALKLNDIEAAHASGRPIVIQSIEGGHFLEGKIERLKVAYDHGLRHIGLLHDSDASTPLGDVFTNPPQWGGLTKFGAEVIKESERLGILVDLAHCDNKTVDMALKILKKPFIISHTGLDTQLGQNPHMAQMMKSRLISKEEAKKVADAGGLICVWTHLADSPMEFAQNIRAMVDVIGVDHVCIGTDTKLTPSYRPGHSQEERIGERTNLAWKNQHIGFYYAVVEALLKTGFSEDEIGKIGGGNYLRVFNTAISK
jgi:membrane dipeptidase